MSQNSEQIESKLCAYIDGELDEKDRADIEKHLQAHPHHRHLLKELAETRRLLRLLPRESAPAELAESFQGQLERSVLLNDSEEETAYASPMRINRLPQYLAAAAVVVLAAGLGIVVYFALPQPHGSVVLNTPQPATALTPDQQRLVDTLASRDAKERDRAAELEPAEPTTLPNGARPDVVAKVFAGDKSTNAMAAAPQPTGKPDNLVVAAAAGAADEAGNDAALRKADEHSADADLRQSFAPAGGRHPLVIVVSAADPKKAREEAAGYLDQLGITATTVARNGAPDALAEKAKVGTFAQNGGAELGDNGTARVIEQAKRLMAREAAAKQLQSERGQQAGQSQVGTKVEANRQLAGAAIADATDAGRGAGAGGSAPSRSADGTPAHDAKRDGAKGASQPDAVVLTPEKKSSSAADPKVGVEGPGIAPLVPAAAAATDPAAADRPAVANQDNFRVYGRAEQVIVAQNVTREQLKSFRESFQSSDDAQVRVLDGTPASEDQRRARFDLRPAEKREQAAAPTTTESLNDTIPRAKDAIEPPVAAKPGTNSVSRPAAPPAALKDQHDQTSVVAKPAPAQPAPVPTQAPAPVTTRRASTPVGAVVHPGERLHVVVARAKADADLIEGDVVVAKDGSITLPESKTVQGGGASVAQVEARIAQAYRTSDVPQDGVALPHVTVQRVAAAPAAAAPPTPSAFGSTGASATQRLAPGDVPANQAGGGRVPVRKAENATRPATTNPVATTIAAAPTPATLPDGIDVVIVFQVEPTSANPTTTSPASTKPAADDAPPAPEKDDAEDLDSARYPFESSGAPAK